MHPYPPGRAGGWLSRATGLSLVLAGLTTLAAPPATLTLAGDWRVRVVVVEATSTQEAVIEVPPAAPRSIEAEPHAHLPLFNPRTGGWMKGTQLLGVQAQETTTPFLLDPASLVLRSGKEPGSPVMLQGTDYEADLQWGTFGRLEAGSIGSNQTVFASYRYTPLRLDAIVLTRTGAIELRTGEPRSAAPQAPAIGPGERRLGNVWLPGPIQRLEPRNLFPVLEDAFPEPTPEGRSTAEERLPRSLSRLRTGGVLRVLAWGDSVTDGGYLPDPAKERWQAQFIQRLRQRFPQATITLVTEAWGGRNTGSYLAEPPGSPHHYGEKVLGSTPDLVVSEFVNDAGLTPTQVAERYGRFLEDFRRAGAEWVILTPHYVRPDWMSLDREREVDDDPRPYVAGLRSFVASCGPGVALADASRRYGRLWRQGIPYTALLLNSINHPDARGMGIFADALMALFPPR